MRWPTDWNWKFILIFVERKILKLIVSRYIEMMLVSVCVLFACWLQLCVCAFLWMKRGESTENKMLFVRFGVALRRSLGAAATMVLGLFGKEITISYIRYLWIRFTEISLLFDFDGVCRYSWGIIAMMFYEIDYFFVSRTKYNLQKTLFSYIFYLLIGFWEAYFFQWW